MVVWRKMSVISAGIFHHSVPQIHHPSSSSDWTTEILRSETSIVSRWTATNSRADWFVDDNGEESLLSPSRWFVHWNRSSWTRRRWRWRNTGTMDNRRQEEIEDDQDEIEENPIREEKKRAMSTKNHLARPTSTLTTTTTTTEREDRPFIGSDLPFLFPSLLFTMVFRAVDLFIWAPKICFSSLALIWSSSILQVTSSWVKKRSSSASVQCRWIAKLFHLWQRMARGEERTSREFSSILIQRQQTKGRTFPSAPCATQREMEPRERKIFPIVNRSLRMKWGRKRSNHPSNWRNRERTSFNVDEDLSQEQRSVQNNGSLASEFEGIPRANERSERFSNDRMSLHHRNVSINRREHSRASNRERRKFAVDQSCFWSLSISSPSLRKQYPNDQWQNVSQCAQASSESMTSATLLRNTVRNLSSILEFAQKSLEYFAVKDSSSDRSGPCWTW